MSTLRVFGVGLIAVFASSAVVMTGSAQARNHGQLEARSLAAYIDPSGTVLDGNHLNAPLPGATVTLLHSASRTGRFSAVPEGSPVMSEANRVNPVASNSEGAFGWEVVPGFYEVRAAKAGCGNATSPILEVPPQGGGLELVLHCQNPLQIETATLPAATVGMPYTTQLEASGGQPPYKWKKTAKLPKGLKLSKTGVLSGTPSAKLTPGEYPVGVAVSDSAKPKETVTKAFELMIS